MYGVSSLKVILQDLGWGKLYIKIIVHVKVKHPQTFLHVINIPNSGEPIHTTLCYYNTKSLQGERVKPLTLTI